MRERWTHKEVLHFARQLLEEARDLVLRQLLEAHGRRRRRRRARGRVPPHLADAHDGADGRHARHDGRHVGLHHRRRPRREADARSQRRGAEAAGGRAGPGRQLAGGAETTGENHSGGDQAGAGGERDAGSHRSSDRDPLIGVVVTAERAWWPRVTVRVLWLEA